MLIHLLKSLAQQLFQERWDSAIGMRQAKELISGQKYEISRENLRTVTGLLTGHRHLRPHQYLMGITEDPTCRGCLEEEESAGHILMWCSAFTRSRTAFLGQSIMTHRAIKELRPSRLVGFIKSTEPGRDGPIQEAYTFLGRHTTTTNVQVNASRNPLLV